MLRGTIKESNLPNRVKNCLLRSCIELADDLLGRNIHEILALRGFGKKSELNLREFLRENEMVVWYSGTIACQCGSTDNNFNKH